MSATLPDETVQLVALSATGQLETPDDYAFDCAAHIGSQLFNVPLCVLILAGVEQDWTNSCVSLEVHETSIINWLCDQVVDTGEPIVVEDVLTDARFARNRYAIQRSRIRFYAGYPIRAASGVVLGALCLINFEPMQFPSEQLWRFRELAFLTELSLFARRIGTAQKALVAKLDVARRESLVDPLLRIWNRGGITTIIDQLHKSSIGDRVPFSILMIDIDRFKRINDRHGHIAGDTVLKAVTRALQAAVRPDDEVGRYGGEEFIAILPNTNAAMATELAHRLNKAVAELRVHTPTGLVGCTVSIGIAEWAPRWLEPVEVLVHRADMAMLSAKQQGRDRVLVSQ
jgi:diguanylate cyclase (GGDEF)-like protein